MVNLEEQREGLNHWYNVYGWEDRCVEEAAASDPYLRRLLEVAQAMGSLDKEALAIRWRITRLEPCHARCRENVEAIVRMIGTMTPASVLGCGQPEPGLVEQLRAIASAVTAWTDGDEAGAGERAQVLGDQTPEKCWLAACLCKTLAEQLSDYDSGEPLARPHLHGSGPKQ